MAKIGINIKEGTVKNTPSQRIIGIDLGTTNSLVAIVKEGRAETLKDADGKNTLVPSVIHFNASGGTDVGGKAIKQLINDPSRTIASVKRLMGKSYSDLSEYTDRLGYRIIEDDEETLVRIEVDGNYYSPVELSALILKALKKRAEQYLNEIIEKAVITVPAYFNDSQRQATRDAGKLAGLDVLRIVNEPTAAALAYGIGLDPEVDECIAVYDLGGGTFDISILKIEQGIFDVLSTNGDTFLGGDDIDHAIADHWRSQHNLGTDNPRLKHIAEEAKKSIAQSSDFRAECDGIILTLTLEKLKEICQPIIQKTLECCALALKDAKLELSDINKVVLVGGSTRLPIIKSAVSEFFEQPVYDELNPDEVVAQGAAIQADILAGNRKDLLLLDITPLSLGIETVGELMDVIVPRNTNIPISAAREYTTSVDGQSRLRVSVFQGERELVSDNRKLGEFILSDIPPMPAGIPKIRISFIIDANGILQVRAKELRSGVEQQVELKSQFGLSEQEMAEMLKSSILNADQDIATRALREAQVEGEQLLMSMAKFKEQHPELVKPSMEKIEALEARIIALINSGGKDEILAAIEELNSFTKPLAEIAMNEVISTAMKGTSIDQKDQE